MLRETTLFNPSHTSPTLEWVMYAGKTDVGE